WLLLGTGTLLGVALAELPDELGSDLVILVAGASFIAAHCLAIARVVPLEGHPSRALRPGTLLGFFLAGPFLPLSFVPEGALSSALEATTWGMAGTAIACAWVFWPLRRFAFPSF